MPIIQPLCHQLSQRLCLRPYREEDAAALHAFMSDADAMRFTYVAASVEACAARLRRYEDTREHRGFAPWVVALQESGEVIGWGGLSIDPDQPQWGLEVSYAFSPLAWGQGYATELVQHSLDCAFSELQAHEVHAFAMPANTTSIRVLQKCGFRFLRHEHALERNHYVLAKTSRPAS